MLAGANAAFKCSWDVRTYELTNRSKSLWSEPGAVLDHSNCEGQAGATCAFRGHNFKIHLNLKYYSLSFFTMSCITALSKSNL